MNKLHKILIAIVIIILVVILGVTLIIFIAAPANIGLNLRHTDPSATDLSSKNAYYQNTAVFSKLGRIRATTADTAPITVIVTPYFPYPVDDTSFFEELSGKNRKIRLIIIDYFSTYTAKKLKKIGEQKIKEDLLLLINKELVMGSLSALFFDEYIFLD